MTSRSPGRDQHPPERKPTYSWQHGHSSCSGCTGTTTEPLEGPGCKPSPNPQNTPVGQTPKPKSAESEELVRGSTTRTDSALFLFNLGFDYRPPFQHLSLEYTFTERLSNVYSLHTPSGLPLLRHWPGLPRNVKEASPPRHPLNTQHLQHFRVNLISPWGFATVELFDYLSDFLQGNWWLMTPLHLPQARLWTPATQDRCPQPPQRFLRSSTGCSSWNLSWLALPPDVPSVNYTTRLGFSGLSQGFPHHRN